MEPIVSPWFVYLLGVVDGIGFVAAALAFTGLLASIGLTVAVVGMRCEEDEEVAKIEPLRKGVIVLTVFFSLLAIFVPSRNTLIAMYVAKNITPDNVATAVETGKAVKDELKRDVLDLIEALKADEAKEKK